MIKGYFRHLYFSVPSYRCTRGPPCIRSKYHRISRISPFLPNFFSSHFFILFFFVLILLTFKYSSRSWQLLCFKCSSGLGFTNLSSQEMRVAKLTINICLEWENYFGRGGVNDLVKTTDDDL